MFQGDYSNQATYGQSNDWMLVRFIEEIYLEDYINQPEALLNDTQREILYVLLEQIREDIFYDYMEWCYKGLWPSEKELQRIEEWMNTWGFGSKITYMMKTLLNKEDITGHLSIYLHERITAIRERRQRGMFQNSNKLHEFRLKSGYYDQFYKQMIEEFDPVI